MLLSPLCLLRDTASCPSLIPALPKLLHDHSQALAAKKPLQHTDLRCSLYQNKLWHSAFLQLCPFLCKLHHSPADVEGAVQQPHSTCLPLYPKLSLPLPLPPWRGVRASCSTALNLFYPVYVASLFLEIHSCGCLKLQGEKKTSWAPPMPPKLFLRQKSDHHFFCCLFPSFTLSLVARAREEKPQHLLLKCVFIRETVEWERAELIFLILKSVSFP